MEFLNDGKFIATFEINKTVKCDTFFHLQLCCLVNRENSVYNNIHINISQVLGFYSYFHYKCVVCLPWRCILIVSV